MNPLQRYMQFHGRKAPKKGTLIFHVPKTLVWLGPAVSIVYLSNKKNGGGDGKLCEFEHEFETPVDLWMDERGKMQLYLTGRHLHVTEDGIQN